MQLGEFHRRMVKFLRGTNMMVLAIGAFALFMQPVLRCTLTGERRIGIQNAPAETLRSR